jgi:hypothetical protein
MNRRTPVSSSQWIWLSVAGLCLGLCVGVRERLLPAWLPSAAEWQSLETERIKLSELVAAAASQSTTKSSSLDLVIPDNWTTERLANGPDDEEHVVYRASQPEALRWADLIAFVVQLEAQSPARIVKLHIRSSGNRTTRNISAFEITVSRPAKTKPRQAGASFPPSGGPAPAPDSRPAESHLSIQPRNKIP